MYAHYSHSQSSILSVFLQIITIPIYASVAIIHIPIYFVNNYYNDLLLFYLYAAVAFLMLYLYRIITILEIPLFLANK